MFLSLIPTTTRHRCTPARRAVRARPRPGATSAFRSIEPANRDAGAGQRRRQCGDVGPRGEPPPWLARLVLGGFEPRDDQRGRVRLRPRRLAQHRGDLIGVLDHGAAAPGTAGGPWCRTRPDGLDQELASDRARAGRLVVARQGADRFVGRCSEQILVRGPDQIGGRAVGPVESANTSDERHGHPGVLAHHQPARRRDLVGERHDGRLQRTAPVVGPATQVHGRRHTGAADRHVDHARPPGAAERVRDDHPEPGPERLVQSLPDAFGRGVGVERQQRQRARVQVRGIDPGVGAHESVPGLGDHQVAPPSHHPRGLGLHGCPSIVPGHQPPLGLGHDLRGDDHDVVVTAHPPSGAPVSGW